MIILSYFYKCNYKTRKKLQCVLLGYATLSGKFEERIVRMNWDNTFIDSNDDEFENSKTQYIEIYYNLHQQIENYREHQNSAARSAAIYFHQHKEKSTFKTTLSWEQIQANKIAKEQQS